MKRLMAVVLLIGAGLGGVAAQGLGEVHAAGNASAAQACQQGGYATLVGNGGTRFSNAGECTSYAARGGTFLTTSITVVETCPNAVLTVTGVNLMPNSTVYETNPGGTNGPVGTADNSGNFTTILTGSAVWPTQSFSGTGANGLPYTSPTFTATIC